MRVLFVEDEKYIAEAVEQVLRKNKYSIDLAFDGEYGLDCALSGIYDVIILDIMLPKMDGLSLLKKVRELNVKTPILMLTARDQVEDKVKGLDYGADDYLAKPFHSEELLARLRALSRRQTEFMQDGLLCYGDMELQPNKLIIRYGARELKLSLKEAQILELLIKNNGIILSKDIIIEKVWGYDADADNSHVETHISLLRKKLTGLTQDVSIRTIRGAGYILIAGEE